MASHDRKLDCLIVLSGTKLGNSFVSYLDAFKLLSTEFNVHTATPNATAGTFFKNCDLQTRAFTNEFTINTCAKLLNLSTLDPDKFSTLVIPHCPGAAIDLANDPSMAQILAHFSQHKKPICAIGMGVVGLFAPFDKPNLWPFRRFKLTAMTIFELTKYPDFDKLTIIPEDVIKERGGIFTCSNDSDGEGHVEVDRYVVTGQNEKATTSAIASLLGECRTRLGSTFTNANKFHS